jgi:hypothetical protein
MWNSFLTGGDSGFYFDEMIERFSWLPHAWNGSMGLGSPSAMRLWFDYPYMLSIKLLSTIGFSWWFIDKLKWVFLIVLAVYSSWRWMQSMGFSKTLSSIGVMVYVLNTYFLMLVSGGQIGVALGVAFCPFVLSLFIRDIDDAAEHERNWTTYLKNGFWHGGALAVLIAYDLRMAYALLMAIALYSVCRLVCIGKTNIITLLKRYISLGFFSVLVVTCVHLFWILPVLVGGGAGAGLGEEYTGVGALTFFSFADFSHALALIHPNWPENIFGKTYFLQPEFLLIPIAAFASLLFVGDEKNATTRRRVIFFSGLAIVGAFLAKGVQEPFGFVYEWFFGRVPGFVMFRDPTKWYLLVALSYSYLIPTTVGFFIDRIGQTKRTVMVVVCVCMWLMTVRNVWMGQTKIFQMRSIPDGYIQLKNDIVGDAGFFRTLWIPSTQRFGYSASDHPVISAKSAFNLSEPLDIVNRLGEATMAAQLSRWGVHYVVVPDDNLKELFLTDRTYDGQKYARTLAGVRAIRWLHQIPGYGSVAVFETESHHGRFWIPVGDADRPVDDVRQEHPAEYTLVVPGGGQMLVFSESYDPHWYLSFGEDMIRSQKTSDGLNSFELSEKFGNATVRYVPDQYVEVGIRAGLIGMVLYILVLFAYPEEKEKSKKNKS